MLRCVCGGGGGGSKGFGVVFMLYLEVLAIMEAIGELFTSPLLKGDNFYPVLRAVA